MEEMLISRNGFEKLKNELKRIEQEIRDTQIKMGESAKNDNDLRENPEYMELRVKLMYTLPTEKNRIKEKLDNCKIIEDTEEYIKFDGTIIPGAIVEVDFNGEKEKYKILGEDEGILHDEEVLSCNAPIAKALIGKKLNDEFNFNGFKIVILSVNKI